MTRRAPAVCQHPKARHQHGTSTMYVLDKCGCAPCTAAATRYNKLRGLRAMSGTTPCGWVDAGPVREHVRWLQTQGVALKTVTALSGAGGGLLTALMYGRPRPDGTRRPPSKRINGATAGRILAVQPSLAVKPAAALVDGTGAARRLQALVWLGWSQSQLADQLGLTRASFGKTVTGRPRVFASTARGVIALYERLWDTPPPEETHRQKTAAARSRRLARERRWKPPMYWDDDLIDTPPASRRWPDDLLVPCGTVAAYRRHLRRGEEPDQACRAKWARGRTEQRREAA